LFGLYPFFALARLRALNSRFAFSFLFCIVGYDIFDIYCLFLVGAFTPGSFHVGATLVERFRVDGRKWGGWMEGRIKEGKKGSLEPTSL
jgi:hypothetical protein